MKKKLALLLAVTMILTSLPMTLLASNRLTNTALTPGANAILFEQGLVTTHNTGARVRPDTSVSGVSGNNDFTTQVERWTNGTNLEIQLQGTVSAGDQFQVRLENGVWFFRDADQRGAITLPVSTPEVSTNAGYAAVATPVVATFVQTGFNVPLNRTLDLDDLEAAAQELDANFELGDSFDFSSVNNWGDFLTALTADNGTVGTVTAPQITAIVNAELSDVVAVPGFFAFTSGAAAYADTAANAAAALNVGTAAFNASQAVILSAADTAAGALPLQSAGAVAANVLTTFDPADRTDTEFLTAPATRRPAFVGEFTEAQAQDAVLASVNANAATLWADRFDDDPENATITNTAGVLTFATAGVIPNFNVTANYEMFVIRAGATTAGANWDALTNAIPNRPLIPTPSQAAVAAQPANPWQGSWAIGGDIGWRSDDNTPFPTTRSTFAKQTAFNTAGNVGGFVAQVAGVWHYYRVTGRDMGGGNVGNVHNAQGVQLSYVLTVGTNNVATITILEAGGRNDFLTVPIVARTTNNNGLIVHLEADHNTSGAIASTPTRFTLGSRADGNTRTSTRGVSQSAQGIAIEHIDFDELSSSVIASQDWWTIELTAPAGYTWTRRGGDNPLRAEVSNGLFFDFANITQAGTHALRAQATWNSTNTIEEVVTGAGPNPVDVRYVVSGNRVDERRLLVSFPANAFINTAGQVRGRLSIANLMLVPDIDLDIEEGRQLTIDVTNRRGTVITPQRNISVVTLNDFGINLEARTEVPTLISGRLEGDTFNTRFPSNLAPDWLQENPWSDEEHKATVVRVSETLRDSWWSQRQTEFWLPEDVRFLAVEIHDITNMRPYNSDDYTTTALTNHAIADVAYDVLWQGSAALGTADRWDPLPFFNTGTRINNVFVDNNRLILPRLHSSDRSTTRFDMHIWLNIQVDFEGPINLALTNTGFRGIPDNYDATLVIANAVRPVEIITQVRDARVGFQFVTTADFAIVENVAGALLHGEVVNVTITDLISTDMAFAPGIQGAVTDGNIRISNVRHLGNLGTLGTLGWLNNAQGGQLSFVVESASRIPSTIQFTDVQVKIDRTVPFSNISNVETSGYDIHVWGPAVARNFLGIWNATEIAQRVTTNTGRLINEKDLFDVGSIREHYVRIETPGELHHTPFSNHVVVPIPSSTVRINGVETDLGVETWIDPVTSSAMVPIRFIAVALGLDESAVHWDHVSSTVTIDAISSGGRIVQFQTGNSAYLINGVAVRMTNAEGTPVEMQIRNERSFVPFRMLGEAFGIPVSWNPDTAEAIFNAPTHFGQEQN